MVFMRQQAPHKNGGCIILMILCWSTSGKRGLLKTLWTALTLLCILGGATPAQADRVDILVHKLKTEPISKVKLTALLSLLKYSDPRVTDAFLNILQRATEDPIVRGFAALALGRYSMEQAIPAIKKATRSYNKFLRKKAADALEMLCPSKLKGKRFYINLDKIRATGPMKKMARQMSRLHLTKILRTRRDVVLGWPGCKKPTLRMLWRKRMKGFYLDATVKMSQHGGKVSCDVNLLFMRYPRYSIKGSAGTKAEVAGRLSASLLSLLVEASIGSLKNNIQSFLNSQ